jgi:hypothetical protein
MRCRGTLLPSHGLRPVVGQDQLIKSRGIAVDDREILSDALKFHGHRCYASVAGVRVGLAALRALGVKRAGGTQPYAILETGEEHGGMCFGDGVQSSTGCTGRDTDRQGLRPCGSRALQAHSAVTDCGFSLHATAGSGDLAR